MKIYNAKYFMLAAIGLAACINPTHSHGTAYVVGTSPHNGAKQGAELFQTLLVFMLETAVPGDEIIVCDALNQKLVTRFVVPQGALFQANARARAQRLAAPMAALKQFLMTEHSYPGELVSAVAFPQFLDFAATQLRRSDTPLRVVILGSPFYFDASGEGACSMDSAVPSDAHLTAEQKFSPFGCALRKHVLSGVSVHYAFLNSKFLNDYHQERITRFWALYCQQAGGVLCTFCADATIAFQRAKENIQQPCVAAQLDANDTRIEMRLVVRRGVPVSRAVTNLIGRVVVSADVPQISGLAPLMVSNGPAQPRLPASEPDVIQLATKPTPAAPSVVALPPTNPPAPAVAKLVAAFPVKPTANKIVVGIAWSACVDLDLWVRAKPSARDLYFNNTTTREGHYLRDWRDRNMGVDYECVEMNQDPSLDLSQIGAWVNYFEGTASTVTGVVIVCYEGQSYFGEFTISAPGGNKADDKDKRDRSRYWVRLNLQQIVGLSTQSENHPLTRQ